MNGTAKKIQNILLLRYKMESIQPRYSSDNSVNSTVKENSTSSTELQNIPVEMLDLILLKVILLPLKKKMKSQPFSVRSFEEEIKSLRIVWSEWNNRINNRWFWIKLKQFSGITFIFPWKRTERIDDEVFDMTTLDNKAYILCKRSIRVCTTEENFTLQKVISLECPATNGKDVQLQDPSASESENECNMELNSLSIHSSEKSKCLYIAQEQSFISTEVHSRGRYHNIVQIIAEDENHSLRYWKRNITNKPWLTVMSDNNILMLMHMGESFEGFMANTRQYRMFTYTSDAVLISSIEMAENINIRHLQQIVEISENSLIISHSCYMLHSCSDDRANNSTCFSQINNSGNLVKTFSFPCFDEGENYIPYSRLTDALGCSIALNLESKRLFINNASRSHVFIIDANSLIGKQAINLQEAFYVKTRFGLRPDEKFKCFHYYSDQQLLCVSNSRDKTIDCYRVF